MKIGLSIYSLFQDIRAGKMTPLEAIRLIADYGADNVELVGFVVDMVDNDELLGAVVAKAKECNLEISAYSIFADVLDRTEEEYEAEIGRIYKNIDLANKLGTKVMRSDFTKWGRPPGTNTIECFERDLPVLVKACRSISDYAKKYGITMTVENHGTFINGSERVARLIRAVDRENFRCTLDVGNCLCVDEDPVVCVKNLLPYTATIHFKDFLYRKDGTACGASGPAQFAVASWLTTNYGNYLRGTIVGDGDVDVVRVMKCIKEYGYDGAISIEFEGPEECRAASKVSLDNVKRYAGSC